MKYKYFVSYHISCKNGIGTGCSDYTINNKMNMDDIANFNKYMGKKISDNEGIKYEVTVINFILLEKIKK